MMIVPKEFSGERLQHFLREQLGKNYSGKRVKHLIDGYGCRVNGRIELFGSYKVQSGDRIHVDLAKQPPSCMQKGTILYEDSEMIIWNKPAGVVSDVKHLAQHFTKTIYLVHRLDKDTTGAMLFAKTPTMQRALELVFKDRGVDKVYHALVQGTPSQEEFTIDNHIGKLCEYAGQSVWGASAEGARAITHFRIIKKIGQVALVECRPITGRTHQIRVHLASQALPILGDFHYHRNKPFCYTAPRTLLHAVGLRFSHPTTGARICVEAPYPEDFAQALHELFS